MKALTPLIFLIGFSCGGKVVGSGTGGSSGQGATLGAGGTVGTGGSLGSGGTLGAGGTSGAAIDSGLPEVDSAACSMPDGPCVLCADDNWHCNDLTLPSCPSGIQAGNSCAGFPSFACLACEGDGSAEEYQCRGVWKSYLPQTCSM